MVEEGLSSYGWLLAWLCLVFLTVPVISLLVQRWVVLVPPQWLPIPFVIAALCALGALLDYTIL